jgi:hypothetical protein
MKLEGSLDNSAEFAPVQGDNLWMSFYLFRHFVLKE